MGSCKYSDATVFSFHPVKIIAGGEGGADTTNSKTIYNKLLEYRNHGIIKDIRESEISSDGKRTKIKARNNDKITYGDLTHKDSMKLFSMPTSSKSLQENLELLLKKGKKGKKTRKRRKKGRKKTKKRCRYKIKSKRGKYKKC